MPTMPQALVEKFMVLELNLYFDKQFKKHSLTINFKLINF